MRFLRRVRKVRENPNIRFLPDPGLKAVSSRSAAAAGIHSAEVSSREITHSVLHRRPANAGQLQTRCWGLTSPEKIIGEFLINSETGGISSRIRAG
jgi:hypothetical protein